MGEYILSFYQVTSRCSNPTKGCSRVQSSMKSGPLAPLTLDKENYALHHSMTLSLQTTPKLIIHHLVY